MEGELCESLDVEEGFIEGNKMQGEASQGKGE
jgi:hypothetical protein